ncbi:MAG: hypothetical protein J6I60_07580 [Bacteroidaceae bacterium]|nr:hypothetical protein [Bacteroidaceae bacterium]
MVGNLVDFAFSSGADTPTSVLPPATFQYAAGRSAWYTLQGERCKERPTNPGIYINNGRKVVVK